MILLSSIHDDGAIAVSNVEAKKPKIVLFYNLKKEAVDTIDEKSAIYPTAWIGDK